jgi:hypothetical protein
MVSVFVASSNVPLAPAVIDIDIAPFAVFTRVLTVDAAVVAFDVTFIASFDNTPAVFILFFLLISVVLTAR